MLRKVGGAGVSVVLIIAAYAAGEAQIITPAQALTLLGASAIAFLFFAGLIGWSLIREHDAQHPVRIAFVSAVVVTVHWTVRRIYASILSPRTQPSTIQGSNIKFTPPPNREETVTRQADVARAVLENQSHGTMDDAERIAAQITFWDDQRRQPFRPYRARPPGNAEPWQGESIPDRVDVPYLKQTHLDVAIRHRDTDRAYAFNTESYQTGTRGQDPQRVLIAGAYTVRIRAKATNSRVTEGWFELRNEGHLSIRQIGRPRLAWLRFR